MYNLFLDDIRNPLSVLSYIRNRIYFEKKWVIVRNYDEFVSYITENGLPQLISFDHDLADIHYIHQNQVIDYDSYEEKTGYDCAKWLIDYCMDNDKDVPEYFIHSMNIVGGQNIDKYIKNYLKQKRD
jgi:NAD+-processing family protein with receiver domain